MASFRNPPRPFQGRWCLTYFRLVAVTTHPRQIPRLRGYVSFPHPTMSLEATPHHHRFPSPAHITNGRQPQKLRAANWPQGREWESGAMCVPPTCYTRALTTKTSITPGPRPLTLLNAFSSDNVDDDHRLHRSHHTTPSITTPSIRRWLQHHRTRLPAGL